MNDSPTKLVWESQGATVTMQHGNGERCWKCHRSIMDAENMIEIVYHNPKRGADDAPIFYHACHTPSKFYNRDCPRSQP